MKRKFNTERYNITPILNDKQYSLYSDWIEEIADLSFDSKSENELKLKYIDTLVLLIEDYEHKTFTFNKLRLTIPQIIEEAMSQLNLTKTDLAKLIGANRVSEILRGKRNLTLSQIRALHKELRFPTEMLLGV